MTTRITATRRPERNLEVLWQNHIPKGVGSRNPEVRTREVGLLIVAASDALVTYEGELDLSDLVVTISRRPMP